MMLFKFGRNLQYTQRDMKPEQIEAVNIADDLA
jgi:hypothetical protein